MRNRLDDTLLFVTDDNEVSYYSESSCEVIDSQPLEVISIKDERVPELVLDKRLNRKNNRVEYFTKFRDYPVESSEWLRYEQFPNKRLVYIFENRLAKTSEVVKKIKRRYHHIGERNRHEFLQAALHFKRETGFRSKKKPPLIDLCR